MKVEELRIGNLICRLTTTNVLEVDSISRSKDITFKDVNDHIFMCIDGVGIKGIPLTEEWLEKFGFRYNNGFKTINIGVFDMVYKSETIELFYNDNLANYCAKCKYVHQLQNLYFALTGKELTLKETK